MTIQFSLLKVFMFLTACAVCFSIVASFGVGSLLAITMLLGVGFGIIALASVAAQLLCLPVTCLRRRTSTSGDNTCQKEVSAQTESRSREVEVVVAAADRALPNEPNSWIMFLGPVVGDSDVANLSELTELKWLVLDNTNVTDAGLVSLFRLTKLRRLYVRGSRVTTAGIQRLKRVLPEVEILH